MNPIIIVLAAFIPSAVLVHHFYRQDKRKSEPIDRILKLFFLGMVLVVLVLIPEEILQSFFLAFFSDLVVFSFFEAFVVAALCEELAKLVLVRTYIYNDPHFDEISDGIFYTIVASLGFACAENILYIFRHGIEVIQMRALFAVPLHASASGIMGYFIGKAKFSKSTIEERNYFIKGLGMAIGVHGTYNFILFTVPEPMSSIIVIIILIFAFRFLYNKINVALLEDESNENSKAANTGQSHPILQKPNSPQPIHPLFQKEIDNIVEKKKKKNETKEKIYKKGDLYKK
jgi:RsiW-degrading membrane proteinase PrsW (M82 family)